MKNAIGYLALSFFLVIASSCANDNKDKEKNNKELNAAGVPDPVKSAFSAKYSTATDIKWEDAHEDNAKTYKTKFTLDGKKIKAEFDAAGNLVKEKEDN